MKFQIGDRVVKDKRYSSSDYCRHGGDYGDVPIGTQGTIFEIFKDGVKVVFDNDMKWSVDESEISLINKVEEISNKKFKSYIQEDTITITDFEGDCIEIPKKDIKELISLLKKIK